MRELGDRLAGDDFGMRALRAIAREVERPPRE